MKNFQILFPRANSFGFGLILPLRALQLIISKPRLIFWSLFPILLTLLLYVSMISYLQTHLQTWLTQFLRLDPQGWMTYVTALFIKLILLVLSAFSFSFTSSVVACPFNDILAEQSERYAVPALPSVRRSSIGGRIKIIIIDIMKFLLALGINLLLLVFSWMPVFSLLTLVATFLLVTFQYISYPQTRRGEGFQVGIRFLWTNFFACIGFGMSITFLFGIPFLSVLSVPVAVVGGTLLVAWAREPKFAEPPISPLSISTS